MEQQDEMDVVAIQNKHRNEPEAPMQNKIMDSNEYGHC